jgi:peptidoglycan hydrolase CwlO-like protein
MKNLLAVAFTLILAITFGQDIKVSEETQTYSIGSKNALVVNIPFGEKDIVESQLRKELKDWNGKYDSGKGEFTSSQAQSKFMGDKPFDAYAKIIEDKGSFRVSFAIDLGGAFLNSKEHSMQFSAMSKKIEAFGRSTSLKCIEENIDKENKVLSSHEKDLRSLEKDKEDYIKDIENYKKKISDLENKINDNDKDRDKKNQEIKMQKVKVSEIEKRKQTIK